MVFLDFPELGEFVETALDDAFELEVHFLEILLLLFLDEDLVLLELMDFLLQLVDVGDVELEVLLDQLDQRREIADAFD